MFERFTDRARQVLALSAAEARDLGHNHLGTEHLLLGLMKEGEGVAAVVLRSLEVSYDQVRHAVATLQPSLTEDLVANVPFTPRAKKALELSLREALQLGHNYIGTEHILLGLIREGEGLAAHVLVDECHVTLADARDRVIRILSGYEQVKDRETLEIEIRRDDARRFLRFVTSVELTFALEDHHPLLEVRRLLVAAGALS